MYICYNNILPYNMTTLLGYRDICTYITFPYGRWEGDKGCQATHKLCSIQQVVDFSKEIIKSLNSFFSIVNATDIE